MIKNLSLPEVSKLGILVDTRRPNLKTFPWAVPLGGGGGGGEGLQRPPVPQLKVSAAKRPQCPRIRRSLSSNRLSMI